MTDLAGFDELFVEFGGELRRAGLAIGTDSVMTFCDSMALLNPTSLLDVYWSGRTTLVRRKDQLPIYDSVFREFFLDSVDEKSQPLKIKMKSSANATATLEDRKSTRLNSSH